MILFENPSAFFFLAALPLLYIFRKLGLFTRFSFKLTFSDWNGKAFSYKDGFSRFFSLLSEFLTILGYILLVTALANPIVRHQEKIYTSRGTDILFVLDTSPSMAARDISLLNGNENRLEAAKIGIRTLVKSEGGANYGLVAMASEAACIVPPTNDIDLFLQRLNSLVIGEFGDGSALGIGLGTAVYHLDSSLAPKKCIVLITDGENNAGSLHPETAAELAREKNISLYTFGIGTRGTVPIEYIDPNTGKIHAGSYESDFDTAPLEKLASLANGKYFGIESTAALSESLNEISKKESSLQTFYYNSVDHNCYHKILILALAAFFSAWLIRRLLLSEVI